MNAIIDLFLLVVVICFTVVTEARADIPSPEEINEQACSRKNEGEGCEYDSTGTSIRTSLGQCANATCSRPIYGEDDAGNERDENGFLIEVDSESYDCLMCKAIKSAIDASLDGSFLDAATGTAMDGSLVEKKDATTSKDMDATANKGLDGSDETDAEEGSESSEAVDCGCRIYHQGTTRPAGPLVALTAFLALIVYRRRRELLGFHSHNREKRDGGLGST